MRPSRRLPAHMKLLLDALVRPEGCAALDAASLDVLVRSARAARLLGVLAARIETAGCGSGLPNRVVEHLKAATAEALHCRTMALHQLAAVEETLRPLQIRLVALKGASYVLRGQASATGRVLRDVDVMVPRERLDEVEQTLIAAGWTFEKTDAYDQRYYREWSHELPPMRAPAMPLELDLHHTILPPRGRLRPDAAELMAKALPAQAGWFTLSPADQVLHAAAHLLQDPDSAGRVRDLVDIDALLREGLATDPGFATAVAERAGELGLEAPLWYALRIAFDWLGTPQPDDDAVLRPAWPGRAMVLAIAARSLRVPNPEAEPGLADRLAHGLMAARAHWHAMPPWLLAFHGMHKLLRNARRLAAAEAGAEAQVGR